MTISFIIFTILMFVVGLLHGLWKWTPLVAIFIVLLAIDSGILTVTVTSEFDVIGILETVAQVFAYYYGYDLTKE